MARYNNPKNTVHTAHNMKGIENMTVKFERREYYDSYGTGNYTEDESKCYSLNFTKKKAEQYADMWVEIGCKHYETSKADFYEIHTDARHYIQYILYK